MPPTWRFEDEAYGNGCARIAGVDEVGRGCLAGPVIAAAVVLDRESDVRGVNDSKLLRPEKRSELARRIAGSALDVGLGVATAEEVDRVNIRQATLHAMRRAVDALATPPDHILLDASLLEGLATSQVSLIKGDQKSFSIAAASIVAKVVRDRLMEHYAVAFPDFGFEMNRGYGTSAHLEALARIGPCGIHRRTFRGVWTEGSFAFEG